MSQKVKKFLFVFPAVFLGLLYPVLCLAGWVETLKKGVGTYILFLIVKLAVNIAKFFTGLAGSLLNWVLSPNFISFSYTNPGGPDANPIIKTGLDVTKGFVNMLLVLILVYIAIATILRLAGYETRKLLVTFIIVALLVNFAPVICGLIVDASNIVMNFFVQDLKADAFGTNMVRRVEEISAGFEDRELDESGWSQIVQLAVMVPFLWILTFILLLFTILFILRYLVIWLLVILSPIAFACYILPATKKYFDQWWEQFINWSMIGITCGFFLYLGLLLVTYVPTDISKPATEGNAVFDGILPFFVSAVFLGIGFVFGLQTSAKGASTVIGFAKTKGKAGLTGAGKLAKRGTLAAGRATGRKITKTIKEKMPEGVQKFGQRLATKRRAGEEMTGVKGALLRTVHSPYYHARRAIGKTLGPELIEKQKSRIKKAEESMKDKSAATGITSYHAAGKLGNKADQIGIINKMIEQGKLKDLMDKTKFGEDAITSNEMARLFQTASKWDSEKTVGKAFPHIAAKHVTSQKLADAKNKDKRVNNKIKVIVSGMKQKDYENISEEAVNDTGFINAVIEFGDGKSVEKLIEKHGKMAIDQIEKTIRSRAEAASKLRGKKISSEQYLEEVNKGLYKYLTKSQTSLFINLK